MNKLKGMRAYLGGGIDRISPQEARDWRNYVKKQLQKYNVIPIDPCDKPIDIGDESLESRIFRQQLINDGKYDEVSKIMRTIRVVDLRLTDISDFAIINFDTKQYMCGTHEEVAKLNAAKKPVLLYCPQGINNLYHWMWGMLPHQHFFETWDALFTYLDNIDNGSDTNHLKRWTFIDYDRLQLPQQPKQLQPQQQSSSSELAKHLNKKLWI